MSKFDKDQTATIVGTYVADAEGLDYEGRSAVVEALAASFKVSVPVVRGVLVAEKVYIKKEAPEAKASTGMDKEALIKAIEAVYGLEMVSMKNMTKKDLVAFWAKIVESNDIMADKA